MKCLNQTFEPIKYGSLSKFVRTLAGPGQQIANEPPKGSVRSFLSFYAPSTNTGNVYVDFGDDQGPDTAYFVVVPGQIIILDNAVPQDSIFVGGTGRIVIGQMIKPIVPM